MGYLETHTQLGRGAHVSQFGVTMTKEREIGGKALFFSLYRELPCIVERLHCFQACGRNFKAQRCGRRHDNQEEEAERHPG